jgi:Predicted transcriptional regulators
MTQDELAERLNVSVSAVSQWELGKTAPDLSLIPVICNLFSITSDELLGVDIAQRKQKIGEISTQAYGLYSKGYNEEAREILIAGLKEFPDSYLLKQNLMQVAYWQYTNDDDKYDNAQRKKFLAEAIKLGEEIFEGCTDDCLRQGAIQTMCFAYRENGELDKAIKFTKKMPTIGISSQVLLSYVQCKGTAGYRNQQQELIDLFRYFESSLDNNIQLDSGEMVYTEEEMAKLREKKIALFDLVFEDGDLGIYNSHLSNTHRLQASYYAGRKNIINTLSHIGLAAKYAIEFSKNLGAVKRTSLIFKGYDEEKGDFFAWASDNDAAMLLKTLESAEFDFVRENEILKEITAELSQYSGKWKTE